MILRGHTGEVVSVAHSNNNKYIASASFDGTDRVWNAETGDCIHTLQVKGWRRWPTISLSPDSQSVVSNSPTGFQVWDIEHKSVTGTLMFDPQRWRGRH